jgi:hypothetical protein
MRGLAPMTPMVDAIRAARTELERAGVYPVCTREAVRILRPEVSG